MNTGSRYSREIKTLFDPNISKSVSSAGCSYIYNMLDICTCDHHYFVLHKFIVYSSTRGKRVQAAHGGEYGIDRNERYLDLSDSLPPAHSVRHSSLSGIPGI